MNKKAIFFIFVSVLAGLNLGTVRKSEDPIRDTQTNPILYEQKMEEDKDGKKGALMYHVKNNPHETFFIDPPFAKEKKASSQEILTEKTASSEDTASWWAEESPASQPVVPSEEMGEQPEAMQQATPVPDGEAAPAGKGDDSWW
jgi:16S rRNA G966 N2-methylase RsmD